jgi:anti-anti-sigma factor
VDQLSSTPCENVSVDVRALSSIDAVGTRVLSGLSHYVVARGGQFQIVGADGEVEKILHDRGLDAPEAVS